MDRAHTDYRGLEEMPLELAQKYLAVMEGESIAADPKRKRDSDSDAPPGFEMETITEVLEA